MKTEIIEKIDGILRPIQRIAIILPERIGVDGLCAALALAKKLQLDSKVVAIFSAAKNLPELPFLSGHQTVYRDLVGGDEFTIRVSGKNAKPKQLRYEKEQDDLVIYITPESGSFAESDVQAMSPARDFELMIILGASSLEQLGGIYTNNAELIFNTPKIVINNNLQQEYFGAVNWVESNASSLSEQLGSWLLTDEAAQREDLITTGLLAGIIDATQSFRDPRTTPQTLALAARLVGFGARRQDIIRHLFKTKSFPLLQLWGRALARIKTVPEQSLIYTLITEQDFIKTDSNLTYLPQVLQELVIMAANYQLVIMAAKLPAGVQVFLAGRPHIKLRLLAKQINPDMETVLEPLNSHYYFVQFLLPNIDLEQAETVISNLKLTGI